MGPTSGLNGLTVKKTKQMSNHFDQSQQTQRVTQRRKSWRKPNRCCPGKCAGNASEQVTVDFAFASYRPTLWLSRLNSKRLDWRRYQHSAAKMAFTGFKSSKIACLQITEARTRSRAFVCPSKRTSISMKTDRAVFQRVLAFHTVKNYATTLHIKMIKLRDISLFVIKIISRLFNNYYSVSALRIMWALIIQHIVTMSKYGHSALNIRHAYSTYILRYS